MKENLHSIDKLFKAAIEDHEETPDANLWEAIDKHLDKNSVIDISRKYVQLKRIAVVLLILLLGFGAYTLVTWKKAKELSKDSITKNNEQSKGINNLSQAGNGKDEKIVPDKIADEKQGNNTQNNQVGTVSQPDNNPEKVITPGRVITDKIDEVEKSNKISGSGVGNEKKTVHDSAIIENQDLTNVSAKTSKEKLPSALSGRKIIIDKRKQKTNITNADLGNVEDEVVNAGAVKNESQVNKDLINLSEIHPELIKAEPYETYKKDNLPGSGNLPQYLTSNTLSAKTAGLNKAPSFTATLFYAPNMSSNHLKNNMHEHRPGGGMPDNDGDREEIRHGENHQYSSTFGVLVDYNINKSWGLQSGVSLSQKNIHIEPKTIYADLDDNGTVKYRYNCSSGYLFLSSKSVANPAVGDSLQAFESTNTLQYLSIPLSVKYNYSFSKIDLFATMGMAVNILTKGKIETELANGNVKETSINNKINGLKSNYFGGNVGIGIAYNITGNVAISFLPSFNFALTSSTKDASVKTYPSSISMGVGIRYKL